MFLMFVVLLIDVPDVRGFEGKEAEGPEENPVPTEINYSVPVSKSKVSSPAVETDAVATDVPDRSHNCDGDSIMDSAERSPVMQNESAGGTTVVLNERTDVLLKRPLKLEMLHPDVSIKQMIATMHSIDHKSLTVAQPQGTSVANDSEVVAESSVVSAPFST